MKQLLTPFYRITSRFLRQSKGAIAIEAAFTLVTFVIILAMIVDLGTAFIQQSRLERATYTAASVFRERIALYGDTKPATDNINSPIKQEHVNQLKEIVSQLLSQSDLVVMVEELRFKPVVTPPIPTLPEFESLTTFTAPAGTRCQSTLPTLKGYSNLSPWTTRKRWLPLYRITVCFPGSNSWYRSIVNSSAGTPELTVEELVAFNIVIPR